MIGSPEELQRNLAAVRAGIESACRRAGRDSAGVTLVAVTKELPGEIVCWARDAGIADFGENYVAELADKRDLARDARWHYVGALQSHTAHRVAELADVVHSLTPGRALRRLAARAASRGRRLDALVQVDFAGRGTGVPPEEAAGLAREASSLDGLRVAGLMTIPPEPATSEDSRPHFRRLRELRDELRDSLPGVVELSMGMSFDYEIAVEEGASMVRVGQALFGPRPDA